MSSKITELASAQLTASDTLTIELVEAAETPAVIIIRWPGKPTILHPRRFGSAADAATAPSQARSSDWLISAETSAAYD